MLSPDPSATSHWAPIALSRDIPAGSSTDTMLHGTGIALWRGHDGLVHAWADRCPHRGMRLSLGFVRENRIVCLYHGWEYGSTGSCQRIPAHPDVDPPTSIRAARYRAAERYGMVWLDTRSGTTRGDIELVPQMPPEFTSTPACSVYIRASVAALMDVLAARSDRMQRADNLLHVTVDDRDLIVGIQVHDHTTTALHICTVADDCDSTELRSIVLWAQRFREDVHAQSVSAS